jgi:hypothetical protein
LITGIAAIGMLVALSGLRDRKAQQPVPAGDLASKLRGRDRAGGLRAGVDDLASGELPDGELVGCPALQQSAGFAADSGTAD